MYKLKSIHFLFLSQRNFVNGITAKRVDVVSIKKRKKISDMKMADFWLCNM